MRYFCVRTNKCRLRSVNAIALTRSSGAAKDFWLGDRQSATPEDGAGLFPVEKSPGQRSISGSLASTLRRPSHLSSYSWKQFIRKIDHLLSKGSMKQFARKPVLTWNSASRSRTHPPSMSKE